MNFPYINKMIEEGATDWNEELVNACHYTSNEQKIDFTVDCVIEIPLNSRCKYEHDKNAGHIRCDRILNSTMHYCGNYGYIPNTLSDDGDAIDCLMLCESALYPLTIVSVKIIGVLLMEDEKGKDEKLIAVPTRKVDPTSWYSGIDDYTELPLTMVNNIKNFFEHYKDLEVDKWVKVDKFEDRFVAMKMLEEARERKRKIN